MGITPTTPHGLLRKVKSVHKTGKLYTVKTEQAALTDLIERCDYSGVAVIDGDKYYR